MLADDDECPACKAAPDGYCDDRVICTQCGADEHGYHRCVIFDYEEET